MRFKNERGQAAIIVVLAMSFLLIGAIGLGVDGAHLYAHRQMAQNAADSAAIAGIMSIFGGTNGGFTPGTAFTCTTSDTKSPCKYAAANGFGTSSNDTVYIDFPSSTSVPGVNLSPDYPVNLIRATVTRNVNTTLMRMLGASSLATVRAQATAAIAYVTAPIPILVNHPTMASSLATNGGVTVQICGGPSRSIQVNSTSSTAMHASGSSNSFDLSKAGPADPGNCTTGTGADFAHNDVEGDVFTYSGGTTGHYVKSSSMNDPLAGVSAPPVPSTPGTQTTLTAGQGICPTSAGSHGCTVLTPGLYTGTNTISLKNTTALFQPGIYYIQSGGFECLANCNAQMASPATADVTTGTGWDGTSSGGGMLVYNDGGGPINIGANGTISLIGSPSSSAYKNILFFEDHAQAAQSHSMGGGGAMSLLGTIYLTNTKATMLSTPSQFQTLSITGGSGNQTLIEGEIIVDALNLGGNGSITMDLNSNRVVMISQIALVK